MWIGGMFESGFARGVNTTLAALPGLRLAGGPEPGRHLPCRRRHPATTDNARLRTPVRGPAGGPGMGPAPDPAVLERHRVRHVVRVGLRAGEPPGRRGAGRIGPGREQGGRHHRYGRLAPAVVRRIALPCNARSSSGA